MLRALLLPLDDTRPPSPSHPLPAQPVATPAAKPGCSPAPPGPPARRRQPGSEELCGKAAQVQQISPGAEELRGHDRDPGMAHIPDEGPSRGGGGAEAWSQDCRSGCEILGA